MKINLTPNLKGLSRFIEIFFPKAIGISFAGNDLLITKVCKRAFDITHETIRISDFLLKDSTEVRPLVEKLGNLINEVVLSWQREKTLIREIDYPGNDINELREALKYQLDSFMPYSAEELYFDIYKGGRDSNSTKAMIVAVKKIELDKVLLKLRDIGIIPTRVIISPISFIPIVRGEKDRVAVIYKSTKAYCYNLFIDRILNSTILIDEKIDVCKKIGHDMPDEVLEEDGLITTMEDAMGIIKDNLIVPIKEIDSTGISVGDIKTEISQSIRFSSMDDTQESFGAALYGIQNNGHKFCLLKPERRILSLQKVLMIGFIGILMFFLFFAPHLLKRRTLITLDYINKEINIIKGDISRVEEIQGRLTMIEETLTRVGKVQAEYSPRIKVIHELSEKLPKDSWIKELYIYRNSFEIGGTALSATDLIPILENSPLFFNVGLTSPVVKTDDGKESFRLKGEIKVKQG